jgi:hypothetical protein
MRWGPVVILGVAATLLFTGCASKPTPAATRPAPVVTYAPTSAAALAFVPPIARDAHHQLDLSRDEREPAAVVGFDSITTTFSYTQWDDRQSDDFSDGFVRQATSARTSISYR